MIGMLRVYLQGLELKRIVCLRVGVCECVKLSDALDLCEVVMIGRFHADEA